jgi:uncharacterized membrane protein YraQ (UPF0718 family)
VTTSAARRSAPPWVLAVGVALLAVALLLWAKWLPYSVKVPSVAGSGSLGSSIVTGGAAAPPAVSLSAGLAFARTYFLAIWPALVAGLVLAAAVQTALPRDWVARLVGRGRGAVAGGALALPGMMCSCCAAPIAVGMRRRAADVRAALAFWLSSPALNPVVLVFCALVLPWPWTLLRLAGGLVVVPFPVGAGLAGLHGAVVVGIVVLLAVAGTLLPVPTGAEVAVVAALLAAGVAPALAAVLLITLPAVSLPSLLMVRGVFPRGLLARVTAVVVATGLASAAVAALAVA